MFFCTQSITRASSYATVVRFAASLACHAASKCARASFLSAHTSQVEVFLVVDVEESAFLSDDSSGPSFLFSVFLLSLVLDELDSSVVTFGATFSFKSARFSRYSTRVKSKPSTVFAAASHSLA